MVLIKNVTTTSRGDQYLSAQHYTILTKVVDEISWTCILQYNKLSNAESIFKKVNSFPFLSFASFNVFQNLHIKHYKKPNVHLMINYIRKDNKKY